MSTFQHNYGMYLFEQSFQPGPEVIKLFFMLSSAEYKIYPIVGILTFMSRINYFNIYEQDKLLGFCVLNLNYPQSLTISTFKSS